MAVGHRARHDDVVRVLHQVRQVSSGGLLGPYMAVVRIDVSFQEDRIVKVDDRVLVDPALDHDLEVVQEAPAVFAHEGAAREAVD